MALHLDLSGQSILVTGGSRGIGEALCRALAKAGARVAVHGSKNMNRAHKIASTIGNGSQAFAADLSQAKNCLALWTEVQTAFGKVNALVNNAGIAIPSPEADSPESFLRDWEQTMAVNLTATAVLSRLAIQHFQNLGGGRLIHISSRAAFRGDQPEYMAYAASKGGMVALHRSIARGYGKQQIKSFLIAPGFVQTEMAQDFIDKYGEDYAVSDLALSSLTQASDLGGMVVLLASGLADHATGSTIDINAGSYVH